MTNPEQGDPLPAPSDAAMRKHHRRNVATSWIFGVVIAAAYAAVRDVPAAGWRISDVTTGVTRGYPELQSRVYDSEPENTTLLAAAAASRLPRWKVLHTDPAAHTVACEVRTVPGLLTDDVLVRIEPLGPRGGISRVQIRSHSRLGGADLGQNARHIRELQAAMDDKLPRLNL